MKANKFIKNHGLDKAKEILLGRRTWVDGKSGRTLTDNSFVLYSKNYEHAIGTLYMGRFSDYDEKSYRYGEINLLMLERLVESHELVGRYGTADEAKEYLPMLRMDSYDELKQAIADVESCR